MKISIVGWYGKSNVGDDAFKTFFQSLCYGHELEFVTPPNYCNNPDIVILGGWAVASPFYLKYLPANCPRYALGLDLAYESEADLLAAANFKEIIVRTRTDAEALKAKVACPVSSSPDLAFYLTSNWPHRVRQYKLHPQKRTLGVFATDYVNPAIDRPADKFDKRARQFARDLAGCLDVLFDEYEIMLVPCSVDGYGDDRRINLDLAAFMKNRPTILMDRFLPTEMIELIEGMDVTLCMRFHSHIFSMIALTPFVSIEFTRKVKMLLKENDLEPLTAVRYDGERFDFDLLVDKTRQAADAGYIYGMKERVEAYSSQLHELRQRVRRDWFGDPS